MACGGNVLAMERSVFLSSDLLEKLLANCNWKCFFSESEKMVVQYVVSIYWAVGTMCVVGYGDIHANISKEVMFVTQI